MILLRKPWTRQPQIATGINPRFASGIKVVLSGAVNEGRVNLVASPSPPTVSGTPSQTQTIAGKTIRFQNATDGLYWPTTTDVSQWSLLIDVRFYYDGASNGFAQWAETTSSSGTPRFNLNNNLGDIRLFWNAGQRFTDVGEAAVGKRATIVLRYDGTTLYYYRNGIRQTYTSGGTNTGSHIWFGNGYSGSAGQDTSVGAWWESCLSDTDAMELSIDPWQIFQPITRRLYFDVAAASGRIMSSLTRHGGLAGSGGIAGHGGGLAS